MQQINKEQLATAALNLHKDIEFVWEKEIPVALLVLSAIWEEMGVDVTHIPVSQQNITKLKESSDKKISYDTGLKTICDSFCRTKYDASSSKFCFSTPNIIEQMVLSHLKLQGVKVNLQKLIIYEDGCHYESNFYLKQSGQIGTVILQVPVEGGHKGGVLSLAYNGKIKSLKSANSNEVFYLAAYFNCCEDSMEPVTDGSKLTFHFEITFASPKTKMTVPSKNFPIFLTTLQHVKEALETWNLQQSVNPLLENDQDSKMSTEFREDILFFILEEKYEKKKLSFEALRGRDKILVEVLMHCGFLELHLAVISFRAEKSLVKTSRWIDSRDATRNLKMNLSLDEHYVGPKNNLLKSQSTESILVIWPKKETINIYGRHGGLRALLIRMKMFMLPNSSSKEAQEAIVKYLRRVILFCCSEPRRVWTQSFMEKGELTLSLLRLCITFQAREEGLILLKSIGSFFENQETDDDVNFEGIQNEEVAKAIADFEHCVTGWDGIKDYIKPFLSPEFLATQLSAVTQLAVCFLNNDCVEGAKMVGNGITHFFADIDPSEVDAIKTCELEDFISMFVTLKSNNETCCKKRNRGFFDFCGKLNLTFLCRLILDAESRLRSKTSFQDQKICTLLCEMLSFRLSTLCKTFSKELPLKIHLILSSAAIYQQLTSSEQGRQTMITLMDCQLKLLKHQETSREESGPAPPDGQSPIKMFSTCIQLYMQTELKNHLENSKQLSLISALFSKFVLQDLMEILTDILMKYLPEGSEKPWFIPKLCELILSRMKDKVTDMPSRELVTNTVKLFLKFQKSLTRSLIMQVCTNEISGLWDHHHKLELMENFISTSAIWEELEQDSKLLILNTSSDLVIVWTSDISGNISSNTNVKDIKILECIQFFFMVEKYRLYAVRSIAVHFFSLLLSKLSTFQLMEISLAILSEEKKLKIKDFPTCFGFVRDSFRLLISKDDFLSIVNPTRAGEILQFLLWLNDEECWQKLAPKICESMPSTESDSFIQAALLIRQSLCESPFAVTAFEGILDCWIETLKSWKEQLFTWRQPFAVLRDYPEVEAFLRSPNETFVYASFKCIREAHNFSKELDESGPKNRFSVEVVADGKGRKSFCKIAKNGYYNRVVMKAISLMYEKLEDVKKLRQHLVEQQQKSEAQRIQEEALVKSIASPSGESDSSEEECTILPTSKRAKRDIPVIDVDTEDSEIGSPVSVRISLPVTTSFIPGAVKIRTNATTSDSSIETFTNQSAASTQRHSLPSTGVSSGSSGSRRHSGKEDERGSRHCFQCNQRGHVSCVCPKSLGSRGRGRARGVYSRREFQHNPNAARGRGFIKPTHTHTNPCHKCNQEGHVSCVCSSSSVVRGRQSNSRHFYF